MKNKRLIALTLLVLLFLLLFASCDKNKGKFTCTLTLGEGATVTGDSLVTVESGGCASFSVSLSPHYIYDEGSLNLKNATYDPATKTVTVSGITEDTEVIFNPVWVDYDTTAEVQILTASSSISVSLPYADNYHLGDRVTVTDKDENGTFAGWSFGKNDTIVSRDNPYTFILTDKIVSSAGSAYYIKLYANYADVGTCYYDPNGGEIHTDTQNYAGNAYMTVKEDGGLLKTKLSSSYLSKCQTGTALWNDGTFTRAGYILKEYNTKADGTGESYSPGSIVYQQTEDNSPFTLYCIWAPYDASKFTTEACTVSANNPENRSWLPTGLRITGYTGNDETVAVPDFINGQPVIEIAAGTFNGKTAMKTLILPRTIEKIQDNAIIGCQNIEIMYYPNGVYYASDAMFENGDYSFLKTLVVYTSMAPAYICNNAQGAFAIKLSRVLSTQKENRLMVIGGSSIYRGLSTVYLQDLLDGAYTVVNFGTTRTTHCLLYVEAMSHYAHDGDVIIYAPENSTYLMGDTALYFKDLRDMEGMNNLFRYVDIGKYDDVFTAFSSYSQNAFAKKARVFESVIEASQTNAYGDCIADSEKTYVKDSRYTDAFLVTMNEYYRNSGEGEWKDSGKQKDYTDTQYWSKFTDSVYKDEVNRVIDKVTACGIPVYFGFCPVDEDAMLDASKNAAALASYDTIFKTQYHFTGVLGTSADYVFAHEYFDDNAFHTNNYGRTLRTYQVYLDVCKTLGLAVKYTSKTDLGYIKKTVGNTAVYMYKDELCYFETVDGKISEKEKYPIEFSTK